MLLGLGTLQQLRAMCVPATFGPADTQFDAQIGQIGRGVSAQFDTLTGRRLQRAEGFQEEFRGGNSFASVTRYPVESIASVEWRYLADALTAASWEPLVEATLYPGTRLDAGLLDFGPLWGVASDAGFLRVTYTGGYFVADDEEGAPALPEGATALPADLALAWQLQCAAVFEACNAFGTASIRTPDQFGKLPPLTRVEILPTVKETLDAYRRMAM